MSSSPTLQSEPACCVFCKSQPKVFCIASVPELVPHDGEWVLGEKSHLEHMCPDCARDYRDYIQDHLGLTDVPAGK